VCGKVVEADAEGEPALRGGVELLDEVGRADEGQRVAFHPGQHFIDLADLPAAFGAATVGEQAVCLVEDQHGTIGARLGKGPRDVLLAFAKPF